MAARDFWPFHGLLGGTPKVVAMPVDTSMTFYEGEPVITIAGYLNPLAAGTQVASFKPTDFLGIAAGRSVDVFGTSLPKGTMIPVWLPDDSSLWITNVSRGSTATTFDTRWDTADVTGAARVASMAVTELGKFGNLVGSSTALNDTTIPNYLAPYYVTTNASASPTVLEVLGILDNQKRFIGRTSTGDPNSPTGSPLTVGYAGLFRFLL